MTDVYMEELARSLHVRGRTRRRFLAECREHLTDLAAATSEQGALTAFGEPAAIAGAFELEVATRRGTLGAVWSSVGVLAIGGSTLALIHGADPGAAAPTPWAIAFWMTAQVAMVAGAVAALQALDLRGVTASAGDVVLLCRRMLVALLAAAATIFSAGAALPGHGSAALLLAGPMLASVAAVAVARAWTLARRLEGANDRVDRSPFIDLRHLTGLQVPILGPLPVAVLCATGAALRDLGETGSSVGGSVTVGAVEASLVLFAYLALRKTLGLRAPTT